MNLKHVLLIDDSKIENYISNYIINQSKMAEKITIMSSAFDALEYLETLKSQSEEFPHTIFLDIQMPGMDGFEFLDAYADFPGALTEHSVVVMLTSSEDPKDKAKAAQYPIVKKYLNKPLNISKLETL